MAKSFYTLILLITMVMSTSSAQERNAVKLKEQILEEFKKQKGTFAVAFKDLTTGQELFVNKHESFHAASTMKTPVLIEAFKQAAKGKFSLADSIWVHNSFKSIVDGSLYTLDPENDSEADLYKKTGQKLPLKELLYSMIIKSSNLATNTVIELVGAANVDKTMKEMGMKDMKVLRGVEDSKAYENGLNNTTNAYDLMLLFQKMALGETVSPEASKSMIDILLDQRFNEIIPARLPVEVKVAHKTGSITGVRHDSGIVFLPGGRKYILVLLSKGLEDEEAAVKTMANISELIFRNVNERR